MANEKLIYILIGLLIFLVLILMIILIIIAFKLLNLKNTPSQEKTAAERTVVSNFEQKKLSLKQLHNEQVEESFFCKNHAELPSQATCLICEDTFCEKCLIEHDSMQFCKEHFKTFSQNRWMNITDIKTTPNAPHEALHIYHFKRKIWKEQQTPSYILTHYKINIDEDFIESFVQLFVIKDQSEHLKLELEKEKGQD